MTRPPPRSSRRFTLPILLFLSLLVTGAPGRTAPDVLYLYGDVSADGKVPSGDDPPFHQMRLNDTGNHGMSQFREAVQALGLSIDEIYDVDLTLNEQTLSPLKVLILGSNQRRFSRQEAAALGRWVNAGGGLIAWSDSAFGGHWQKVGISNTLGRDSNNDLTTQFGMFFLTDNGGGNYRIRDYTEPHYLNRRQKENSLAFRGEGVSPIRISGPARMLARLQEGGLGGKIMLRGPDGKLRPNKDAALAVAEPGKGRVVGVFDRNTFWNAGEGTRLSHDDNREFAQRLILWAAQMEDQPLPE